MPFLRGMSRRDAILILVGALSMQLFMQFVPLDGTSITINQQHPTDSNNLDYAHDHNPLLKEEDGKSKPSTLLIDPPPPPPPPIEFSSKLPETTIISHAPGWTLFRDVYMANGTLFIVSSSPKSFPEIRLMTSTSMYALNTPENIAAREPTKQSMDFLSPTEARHWWGGNLARGESNRVWSVEGNTVLYNDPNQFINHYYHFAGELLVGTQAFWTGAFTPPNTHEDPTNLPPRTDITLAPVVPISNPPPIPPITRMIFAYAQETEWRDDPGFNGYFLRATFPSVTVESQLDWEDRINATYAAPGQTPSRAWHFPTLLITDRSASFRGVWCGQRNQRTAAEAVEKMREAGRLPKDWWESIRQKLLAWAKAHTSKMESALSVTGAQPQKIIITYISRQAVRRHLIDQDHENLVKSLQELVQRKNAEWMRDGRAKGREWELQIVQPETLTKDEQVQIMSKTTIMLGVHGNGLTHLILMAPSSISTVIEILFPGGFAHDYQWTSHAMGHKHFGIWNDTYFTEPNIPDNSYVEGFQGTQIPVYGPTVAKLIEDRVAGLV